MAYHILGYTEFIIIKFFVNIVVVVSSCKSKITYTVLVCETSVQRWLPHLLRHNYDPGGYRSLCRSSIDTRNFNIYRALVFLPLHGLKAGAFLCSDYRGSAGVLVHCTLRYDAHHHIWPSLFSPRGKYRSDLFPRFITFVFSGNRLPAGLTHLASAPYACVRKL